MMSDVRSPKWNEDLECLFLEPENKEIAFIVKHENEGGDLEVLAQYICQIPDLVAACKNNAAEQIKCRPTLQLDPQGVLHLKMSLEEETMDEADRQQNMANGEEIIPVKGHRFVIANNWISRTCAFCRETVSGMGTDGLTCKECCMIVHKKCVNSVLVTCQGKDVPYMEGDLNIEAGIPQSLVVSTFGRPTFCWHCSKLLLGLWNQGLKCTANNCAYVCHEGCKKY